MKEDFRSYLLQRVKNAIAQLWMYDEIGRFSLVGTSRTDIYRTISDFAANALGRPDIAEDSQAESVLIELYELPHLGPVEAEHTLRETHAALSPNSWGDVSSEDKMQYLVSLVPELVREIKEKPSFEEGHDALLLLDKVVGMAIALAWNTSAPFDDNIEAIRRLFEHSYREGVLRNIYDDIRSSQGIWGKLQPAYDTRDSTSTQNTSTEV